MAGDTAPDGGTTASSGAGADPVVELGARVGAALPAPVSSLEVLPGGHSGLTYRVSAAGRPLVIKAVPPGRRSVGRHDVVRQARILRVLTSTDVPVPGLVLLDETEPAWFAMEWVVGEAVEPVLDGITLPSGLARIRALKAAEVLAALHAVDAGAIADEPVMALPDEMAKWDTTLHAGPAEFIPAGERLSAALSERMPQPWPAAIVHGDYRLGNMMFDGQTPAAVVDWEIWSVGDPRVDLGYFTVFADADNFPEIGTAVPELPTADELADTYGQAAGRTVEDLGWFAALGRFRMAAIMAHNLRRHRDGRHRDEAQETLPATIHRLTQNGLDLLESRVGRAHG